ncbi:hypothetical protein DF185_05365 [Marinifilum breve]|uniref:O-methyltransferase dimerisation domain-containing protein n=1 Tax=Marinifilum breve TaxID=2184082 RepID=A0A2V4ADH1_9BACT|nr:methyltransferase dimerization domain-containing protein [Marinifilum breve]PXY02074.1 hypothetical protein DF185_05365 [Marinifilum breve]
MDIITTKTAYSQVNNLLFKSYLPNIIYSAIEVGIFDQLAKGPKSCVQLAKLLNAEANITESLLEVLHAIDYLKRKDYTYSLTDLAKEYLTQESEVNQITAVKQFTSTEGPFANLTAALKGKVPEFNQNAWSSEEAIRSIEQGSKAGALQYVLSFVKDLPEFIKARKMCDFAGNSGYYSYAFLSENSNLQSHVYDLKEVCKISKRIKKDEKGFNRVSYHSFDLNNNDEFGEAYDFFFSSHFLYKYDSSKKLVGLLKKINKSMKMGALFVSNHMTGKASGENYLTLCIVELMTRAMGFPTHSVAEDFLKDALTEAGFECRYENAPDERIAYPGMIIAAIKVSEVEDETVPSKDLSASMLK